MASVEVRPSNVDKSDDHVAKAFRARKIMEERKSAQPGRWVGAWPIFPTFAAVPGTALSPQPTPISTALNQLIAGQVDVFQQAVSAQQNPVPGTPAAGFQQGQAPWNNFLGTNTKPMFVMFPNGGGFYIGNLWDMVSGQPGAQAPMSGFYSAMAENVVVTIQIGQQPTAYIPLICMPSGIRLDRRASSTIDNALVTTEGFGPLNAEGVREMPEDTCWDDRSQIQMIMKPTLSLQLMLASLTSEMIPICGTMIGWMGYGTELRSQQAFM